MTTEPYFLQDSSWFYYDEEEGKYKLTEAAPEKARQSYAEFYKKGVEPVWEQR